jgi:hypothetical protein
MRREVRHVSPLVLDPVLVTLVLFSAALVACGTVPETPTSIRPVATATRLSATATATTSPNLVRGKPLDEMTGQDWVDLSPSDKLNEATIMLRAARDCNTLKTPEQLARNLDTVFSAPEARRQKLNQTVAILFITDGCSRR